MSVRCLIVDDCEAFLQAARRILESGGITVVGAATSSAEALVRVNESNPDVVLVDIMLGSESGFDLARELTTAPRTSRAAVILISTHGEDEFSDLIAASPAIGFLPKWRLSAKAIEDLLGEPGSAVEYSDV
ncbi:MAG TPA: response regulator transcription factor [Actinomycetota bacterium]|nr:response regulator transcription factor [Actinomycetota bacterium]